MERLAGKIILLWGWRRALLAFLAGAFAVLAQPPFDFFAVCFVSFPVLVWLVDGATPEAGRRGVRRLMPAFAVGWWFGLGYFVAGLWWIGNALLVEAESFAWALPLAVVALPAFLALFWGFATALARLFWTGEVIRIAALALGFGVAEWLRSFLFTGFPWIPIGQAAMPVPLLMQSAWLVGGIGVSALAVFVFASPALAASPRGTRLGGTIAAAIVVAHAGFGIVRLATISDANGETTVFRIVQPSIPQTEKWDADTRDAIFRSHLDLSAAPEPGNAAAADFLVWPETSVPFLFSNRPDALVAIGSLLEEGQVLLAGAVRREQGAGERETRYYNSIVAIDSNGEQIGAADKVHLVPFGEYLPFGPILERIGLRHVVNAPSPFTAGTERRPIEVGGRRLLALICYEIIFPAEFSAAAEGADFVVNVTNDAWYGNTPGPYQHLRHAQISAVETGIPVIRAANNGISAAIDPYGRILDALSLDAVGALDVSVASGRPQAAPGAGGHVNGMLVLALLAGICAAGLMIRRAGSG